MRKSPFFSTLLLNTPVEMTQAIPTMAVSGKPTQAHSRSRLLINPDFADTLSDEHYMSVVCHEVLHLALNHIGRGAECKKPADLHQSTHLQLLNIAADIIVNGIIESANMKLPEGAITEKTYAQTTNACATTPAIDGGTLGLSKWSLPKVYQRVLKDLNDGTLPTTTQVNICIGGASSGDDSTSTEGSLEGDAESASAEGGSDIWDEILETAKLAEKMGHTGGNQGLLSHLDEYLENSSYTDYKEILSKYIYNTPDSWDDLYDRRFIHQHTYLDYPTLDSLDLKILIDVSGSINAELLNEFLNELRSNLLLSKWARVNSTVYFFHTELIAAEVSLLGAEALDANQIPTGGGTNFGCWRGINTNEYAHTHRQFTIVYTDGFTTHIEDYANEEFYNEIFGSNNILWVFPAKENTCARMREIAHNLNHEIIHL